MHRRWRFRVAGCLPTCLGFPLLFAPLGSIAQTLEIARGLKVDSEVHVGTNIRLARQDPAQLVDVNYDDGNRNFNKGVVNFGTALHSTATWRSDALEGKAKIVLFHDFLLHNGETDNTRLTQAAINRVGQGGYVREAWLGVNGKLADGAATLRLGNQVFMWGESTALDSQINMANPLIASRRWLPGGSEDEVRAAIPALSASWKSANGWKVEGFYGFAYRSTEGHPLGTLLGGNDYDTPGASQIFVSTGNPLLDAVLGTTVPRGPNRKASDQGGGVQVRSAEFGGDLRATMGVYGGRFSATEPIIGATIGSVLGPLGNFAATSRYFVEQAIKVPVAGFSLKLHPSQSNQLRIDFSVRRNSPMQVDDREMISGVYLIGTCAATGDPAACGAADLNKVVARQTRGVPLTQGGAIALAGTDISGTSRHDLSQLVVGFTQGLPNFFGSKSVLVDLEHVLQTVASYDPAVLPLRVDGGVGATTVASRSAALYRIGLKIDWGPIGFADAFTLFAQLQHDYRGYAATPRDIIFAGRRTLTLGGSVDFAKKWSAQALFYGQLNKGNAADTLHDRRMVNLNVSYRF